jgi:hypothetical protein
MAKSEKKGKPLKIKGTLADVLKAAGKPKPEEKKK